MSPAKWKTVQRIIQNLQMFRSKVRKINVCSSGLNSVRQIFQNILKYIIILIHSVLNVLYKNYATFQNRNNFSGKMVQNLLLELCFGSISYENLMFLHFVLRSISVPCAPFSKFYCQFQIAATKAARSNPYFLPKENWIGGKMRQAAAYFHSNLKHL